ncbi:MAG: hypothetical protein WCF88_19940 [Candidatus Acidiferrales bacterium]|jgi:hypothetical protein
MPSTQQLERTNPAELATMCQRVADNPGAYLQDASDEASKLKLEWDTLQTFPNPNYAVQKKIELQKDHLGRRMVEFLTRIL